MKACDLRRRPIRGGLFGVGRFEMATQPCIANGLHAVRHMVIEPRAGIVLASSLDKREALANARRLLKASNDLRLDAEMGPAQQLLWAPEEIPESEVVTSVQQVPRRRREVFERSQGKCHYCSTPLSLTGKWHIEHMLSRALGGTDDPINLVAACTPCNLRKGSMSAIEYVVSTGSAARE